MAAIAPRWATGRERLLLVGLAVGGYAAAYLLLLQIGSWGPRTEAWILAGLTVVFLVLAHFSLAHLERLSKQEGRLTTRWQ